MADRSRIPRGIINFNTYLVKICAYLQAGGTVTNASRLGVTEEELADLLEFLDNWQPLFVKYVDKENGRTQSVTASLKEIFYNVNDYNFTHKLLDRIASSTSATITDYTTFRIKKNRSAKRTSRTFSTTVIEASVSPAFVIVGVGVIKVKCKNNVDKGQHILPGSDCVQYMYQIDGKAPAGADVEGLSMGISTRASFTLSFNSDNSNKLLYVFFRWYHTKYPALAGPWTNLQTMSIP